MRIDVFTLALWSLGGVGLLYAASAKAAPTPAPKRAYELSFRVKNDKQAQEILNFLDTVGSVSEMGLGLDFVAPNGRKANLAVKWVGTTLTPVIDSYGDELVHHLDRTAKT